MARLSLLAAGLALMLIVLIGSAVTAVTSPFGGSEGAWCLQPVPGTDPDADPAELGLDEEQIDNAQVIITVGQQMGVPPRGWVIATATALQESGLRNLPHLGAANDQDSLGLFQQRPSQGWGTPEQIGDPAYAAAAFYDKLITIDGWEQLPLAEAAQAVQVSAFPDAYAKWEPDAVAVAAAVTGTTTELLAFCGAGGWVLPVNGPVTSGFRTTQRPDHDGIDIAAAKGTRVRAAAAGTVVTVGCNAHLPDGSPYSCDVDGSPQVRGCGWYLELQHVGRTVTRYCHLATAPLVQEGEQIHTGQVIGVVGSSANSSGPHLHLETHTAHPATPDTAAEPIRFFAIRGVTIR